MVVGLVHLVPHQSGSQCLFLRDEVVDTCQDATVAHVAFFRHRISIVRRRHTSGCFRTNVTPMTTKPEIEFPDGPAPTQLVIEDLEVGGGAEAVPGATVEVHYLGVEYDTGEEFDSSWNRGESIEFPLRGLIAGWQDGIPGMRVGGRRKLVIPPEQAYGPAGSGHRLSGKTLIFVIDLLGTR